MIWSLVLCLVDAKQDPVVYGAVFGVVFLAEGPRTTSKQEVPDCLCLYQIRSGVERLRFFLHTKS